MGIYEELQARGLLAQVTNEEEIREMVNAGKAKFYIGFDCTADSLTAGHFMALTLMKRLQMAGNQPVALIGGGLPACGDVKIRSGVFPAQGLCRILPNHVAQSPVTGLADGRQPHGHRDRRPAESPYEAQGHGGAKAINDVAGVAGQAFVRHYAFSRARWCLTRAVITPPSCSPSSHGMRTPYIFSAMDSTYAHDFLVSRRRALILLSRFSNSGRTFGPFGRLSFHPRLRRAATSITNWRSVQSAEERLPVRFCNMAR